MADEVETFIIERGIPLPVEEPKALEIVPAYPFGELEVGDSFAVPGIKKTALMAAFKAYAKANDLFWDVFVDNTPSGARIWRIEPEAEDEDAPFDGIYRDADGVPLNDTYHTDGIVITDLPDGIYLSMPDYVYFAQKRIGSSDLMRLADDDPESWWYGSKNNPDVEETEAEDERLFGQGLHSRVLEGETAFDEKFVISPYDAYQSREAKAWRRDQVRRRRAPVKKKTYRSILALSNLLLNHKGTKEKPGFSEYVRGGLSEVTILFTVGGLRFRVRYDKLKIGFIADLKSMGRHKQSTVSPQYLADRGLTRDQHTCLRIIRDMRYPIQRYLYSLGRIFLRDFVRNHSDETPFIYDVTPKRLAFLQEVAAEETWDFVWLFVRKISNTTKNPCAPIITPIISTTQDVLDLKGYDGFEVACENYVRLMETFGPDVGWARFNDAYTVQDVHALDIFGAIGDQPKVDDTNDWDDDVEETVEG